MGATKTDLNRKSSMNNYKCIIYITLFSFYLAGCANQPINHSYDPPGFFLGFFHGYTIFFSLIGSFFVDVRIYAFPNDGILYDLGYFFGVTTCGAGFAAR